MFYITIKTKLSTNDLSTSINHVLPLDYLNVVIGEEEIGTVYIDRLKSPEEKSITGLVDGSGIKFNQNVKFEDSKRIKQIQLADFYAGAVRHFVEQYMQRNPLPCFICKSYVRKNKLCTGAIKKHPLIHLQEITEFSHMIEPIDNTSKPLLTSVMIEPVSLWKSLRLIDCFWTK